MQRVIEQYAVPLSLTAAFALCVLSLSQSALLLVDAPYDIYIPLDAGLRLLDGIIPSRDYPSPIGPLYASLHGLTLFFDSIDARSIVWSDVLVLLFSYLLLWPVSRGQPKLTQSIIVILLAAVLMTPLALDTIWYSYRYVADYNRWGWAFFSVVLLWGWNSTARDCWSQIALAVALICLFYLKLTLFAGAVMYLGFVYIGDPEKRAYRLPVGVVLLASLCGLAGGFLLSYVRDNLGMARATGGLRLTKLIAQAIFPFNLAPTVLSVLLCFLPMIDSRRRLLLGVSLAILHLSDLQNFDTMVPLISLPLLLIAPDIPIVTLTWLRPLLTFVPALLLSVGLFLVAAMSLAWQSHIAAEVQAQPMSTPGTLGARIAMTTIPYYGPVVGAGDLRYAGDMIYHQIETAQQLVATLPQGTRIATLEVSNIAVASWPRIRPASGGLLWYDYRRTFVEASYPAPKQIFAGADAILVPRHYTLDSTRILVGLYQAWLARCAHIVAVNDLWQIYRLNVGMDPVSGTAATASGDADCQVLARP